MSKQIQELFPGPKIRMVLAADFYRLVSHRGIRVLLVILGLVPLLLGPLLTFCATTVPSLVIMSPLGSATAIETVTIFVLPLSILSAAIGMSSFNVEKTGRVIDRSRITLPKLKRIFASRALVLTGAIFAISNFGIFGSAGLSYILLSSKSIATPNFGVYFELVASMSLVLAFSGLIGVSLSVLIQDTTLAAVLGILGMFLVPMLLGQIGTTGGGHMSDFFPISAMQSATYWPRTMAFTFASLPAAHINHVLSLALLAIWVAVPLSCAFLRIGRDLQNQKTHKPIEIRRVTRDPVQRWTWVRAIRAEYVRLMSSRVFIVSNLLAFLAISLIPVLSASAHRSSSAANEGLVDSRGVILERLAGLGATLGSGIWFATLIFGISGVSIFAQRRMSGGIRRELLTSPSRRLLLSAKVAAGFSISMITSAVAGVVAVCGTELLHPWLWKGLGLMNEACVFFFVRIFVLSGSAILIGIAFGVIFRSLGVAILGVLGFLQGIFLFLAILGAVFRNGLANDLLINLANLFPFLAGTLLFQPGTSANDVHHGAVIMVMNLTPDHRLFVIVAWALALLLLSFRSFRKQTY